jgi:hypothetical protein
VTDVVTVDVEGCTALHNALSESFGSGEEGAEELQLEHAEAIALASLAFKDAGAYVSARTCVARALEACVGLIRLQVCVRACVFVRLCVCLLAYAWARLIRLQLKAREGGMVARAGRLSSKMIGWGQPEEAADAYVLQNLKRIKMLCSCQLVHVTASALFAHACLLQDCSAPAAAAVQFDCAANVLQWLQQPTLRAASLLRAVECEGEGRGLYCCARASVFAFV